MDCKLSFSKWYCCSSWSGSSSSSTCICSRSGIESKRSKLHTKYDTYYYLVSDAVVVVAAVVEAAVIVPAVAAEVMVVAVVVVAVAVSALSVELFLQVHFILMSLQAQWAKALSIGWHFCYNALYWQFRAVLHNNL